MKNKNLFEAATRNKMRFPFKGLITVEDLWDLSVQNLDSVFKVLNSEMKQVSEESLLNTKTNENTILEAKIEIVKYIVSVKLEEAERMTKAKEQKEQKQKILSILSSKQEQDLQNKSIEELNEMLKEFE
ncbi:MAG: hypothetical protein ACRC1P_09430 [Cellulosilyticaceae bacterium]